MRLFAALSVDYYRANHQKVLVIAGIGGREFSMGIEYFVYMLLLFLGGSVLLGLIRKFKGGPFFPEPGPGEDRLFKDKQGRWWREEEHGTIEPAFRKPSEAPSRILSLAARFARGYTAVLIWLIIAAVVISCIGALFPLAASAGVPTWLLWAVGIVAYLMVFRFGRRRGWY